MIVSKLSANAEEFFLPSSGSSSSAKTSDPSVQHAVSPASVNDAGSAETAETAETPLPPSPPFLVPSPPSEIHRKWHRSPRGISAVNDDRGRSAFRSQKTKARALTEAALAEATTAADTLKLAAAVALASLLAHANSTLPFGVPPILPALSMSPSFETVDQQTSEIVSLLSAATAAITVETSLREQKDQRKQQHKEQHKEQYKEQKKEQKKKTTMTNVAFEKRSFPPPSTPTPSRVRSEGFAGYKQQTRRYGKPSSQLSAPPLLPAPPPPQAITTPTSADELSKLIEDAPTALILQAVLTKVKSQKLLTSIATSVCIAVKKLSHSSSSLISTSSDTSGLSLSRGSLAKILSHNARTWTDDEFKTVSAISLSAYVSSGCSDDVFGNKIFKVLAATLSTFSASTAISVLEDIAELVTADECKNHGINVNHSPSSYKVRQGLIGQAVDALVVLISGFVHSSSSTTTSFSTAALSLKLKQSCLRSLSALRIQALPLVVDLVALPGDLPLDSPLPTTASALAYSLSVLVTYRISDSHLIIDYANAVSKVSHEMSANDLLLSVYSLSSLLAMTADAHVTTALTSSLSHLLQRSDNSAAAAASDITATTTSCESLITIESAHQLLLASELGKVSSPPFSGLFSETLRERCSSVFIAPLTSKKKLQMISVTAKEVAASLVRIGATPRMSDPILEGALTVDVVVKESNRLVYICIKGPDCFRSETFVVKNDNSDIAFSLPKSNGMYTETGDSFLSELVLKGSSSSTSSSSSSLLPTMTHCIPFFVWDALGTSQAAHDEFVSSILL